MKRNNSSMDQNALLFFLHEKCMLRMLLTNLFYIANEPIATWEFSSAFFGYRHSQTD